MEYIYASPHYNIRREVWALYHCLMWGHEIVLVVHQSYEYILMILF